MSFLKITDPSKRDFIVDEFLKTKRRIQQSSLSDKLGDINLQQELTKLYKPITESQAGIAKELSATSTALKALPAVSLNTLTLPQYPSIEAFQEPEESIRTLELGDLATKYLHQYAANKKAVDTTFGIYSKDGQFFIGTSPITIQGDDITVSEKIYTGTPGLWELLTMANPNKSIYSSSDFENYAGILDETNAMRQPKNPSKPKSSRSAKYKEIIKPIWDMTVKGTTGKGVTASVILPSDPNALVEMLSLRIAGYEAGNTGAIDEAIAICDELLRQGVLDKESYKAIMVQLNRY